MTSVGTSREGIPEASVPTPPRKTWHDIAIFAVGCACLATFVVLSFVVQCPTPSQQFTLKILASLGSAAVGWAIPGFLALVFTFSANNYVRAGGALALFVLVFLVNPPALMSNNICDAGPVYIDCPPGSIVLLDGKVIGESALWISPTMGSHVAECRPPGAAPLVKQFDYKGQSIHIELRYAKDAGEDAGASSAPIDAGTDATVPDASDARPIDARRTDSQQTDVGPPRPCAPSEYRRLPRTTINDDLAVEDDCLLIPRGTTVTIAPGKRLSLIALRGLSIQDDTHFVSTGAKGTQGKPAAQMEIKWEPSSDHQDDDARCICQGTNCTDGMTMGCKMGAAETAALTGKKGNPGEAAGNLTIIAFHLNVGKNVGIELNGGPGGEPGQSGTGRCGFSSVWCNAPAVVGEVGDPGQDGLLTVFTGDEGGLSSLLAAHGKNERIVRRLVGSPHAFASSLATVRNEASEVDVLSGK